MASAVVGSVALLTMTVCGGCSSEKSSTETSRAPDASVDAGPPQCGARGEKGNELGVGKFCNSTGDCAGNHKAGICATFLEPNEHFCSMLCPVDGGPDDCGSGSRCVCQSNICGCVPMACADDAGL